MEPRLVHFFRKVELIGPDAVIWPEQILYASCSPSDYVLEPLFTLRHAIRMGRIYATWAFRDRKPTIYGDEPAVCFSELGAQLVRRAVGADGDGPASFSPYSIILPKKPVIDLGAVPVINEPRPDNDLPVMKRLRKPNITVVAAKEQFRYVQAGPDEATSPLHEAEWRWPFRDPEIIGNLLGEEPPTTSNDIGGLNLNDQRLLGVGITVKDRSEIEPIVYDILTKIDRGDVAVNHFAFIVPISEIDFEAAVRDSNVLVAAFEANSLRLSPDLFPTLEQARETEAEFQQLAKRVIDAAPPPRTEEYGGCWLWLLDNQHRITRALVRTGAVTVNRAGRYLMRIDAGKEYSLRQRENMARKIASLLRRQHGLKSTYFSVLGKLDPNEVPFFTDVLDDEIFHNGYWGKDVV